MTLDVAAEDSVFYGLAVPGSSTKGNEAYMTVTVDGTLTATVGGASSGNTSKPYSNSFAIPVTQGSHSVSFRLRDANSMAYLLGLGLVSGDNQTVTLKATDFDTLPGCASYTVTVNGIDVTTDVKSAAGYTAPYGSVAQFAAVNADGAKYVFQNWSTGDYSATSVIPDVDTVGMGQLILRGNATLTPVYTEGVNVASAIMADPAEKAPDGNDYQWTMNSASYFSINTDGAVAIAEGGALSLEFTVPEGQVYMSRIQGNCDFTLYKDNNKINDYDLFQPTGYCYSVLDTGSYKMVFTGSSTGILDNFTCQPYGSMGYGKVTIAASQPDKSDATQVLADSGALPAIEYIFNNIDSFGYVADGYTDKVVKCSGDLNFALDKTKLENAGLSALNADKADGSGTVSFNTNGTTLTIPFSNFLLSQDGSYSYRVHINLQSTGGYPYLSGTTLYANGCPIYVSDGGKVYFYNKTDGSYTEPVKNLSTGDAQITLGSGAAIYGGSNKADVASTYVSLAYNTAGYTVYGGGNSGYGVTDSSAVVCPGGFLPGFLLLLRAAKTVHGKRRAFNHGPQETLLCFAHGYSVFLRYPQNTKNGLSTIDRPIVKLFARIKSRPQSLYTVSYFRGIANLTSDLFPCALLLDKALFRLAAFVKTQTGGAAIHDAANGIRRNAGNIGYVGSVCQSVCELKQGTCFRFFFLGFQSVLLYF